MKQHFRSTLCLISAITFGCALLIWPVITVPAKPSATLPLPLNIKLWPGASVMDKSEWVQILGKGPKVPRIQIGTPSPKSPPLDPLKVIAKPNSFRGVLTYAPRILLSNKPGVQEFLILRGLGVSGTVAKRKTSVATYLCDTYQQIHDPQFSPDGRFLLFKVGDATSEYDSYELYLWNLKTSHLTQIAVQMRNLNYRWVWWSPDSNYIAYISGGDKSGYVEDGTTARLSLWVHDLKAGKSRLIVRDPVVTNVAWTEQGTLLYSTQNEPDPRNKAKMNEEEPSKPQEEREKERFTELSIYEVPAAGGEPKKVFDGGMQPTPSPDGRWIAFLGWPDATETAKEKLILGKVEGSKLTKVEDIVGVYLYDRKNNKRILLNRKPPNYMLWSRDSRTLIEQQEIYKTVGKTGLGEARVITFDITPESATIVGPEKKVAVLTAKDFTPVPGTETFPQFEPKLSRDGKFLFMKVREFTGHNRQVPRYYDEIKSLRAVNLNGGAVSTIARIDNKLQRIVGWDWYDKSTATAVQKP